jgi:glycosyltransferase involved in cell wall biosynthesis
MRVTIDLTAAVQGHAGLGRYADELARALLATQPADEELAAFYVDPAQQRPAPPLDALPCKALAMGNKPWRLSVALSHTLHQSQAPAVGGGDVFLATDHVLPYLPKASTIFTIADVTYLSHAATHAFWNRTYLRLLMPRFLRAASAVVGISRCTVDEATATYPFIAGKTHVIYPGVNPRFHRVEDAVQLAAVRARYSLPPRFLLYVGTIEPRKNLPVLFEAFRAATARGADVAGVKLVIAGKKGWLYDETFARLRALGLENDVLFPGFVPDDDLPALYSLAECFVFPSLYEGFGLPVAEALACGCPTISSNTSSLPEVAGDAALLAAPDDVQGWAEAIGRVCADAGLRTDLAARGPQQVRRFTWEGAAQQTRILYRGIYGRGD